MSEDARMTVAQPTELDLGAQRDRIGADPHPDVTDDREPEIPSYETAGPYDYGSPFEEN
jgi:hypothetical protein